MKGLHLEAAGWFDAVDFVLVNPSHPGNVGAVARAMRVMGFARLSVVAPRYDEVLTHADAIAFASGAQSVLQQARVVGSLDEALAGVTLAVAVSAAGREFGPQPQSPEQVVHVIARELRADPQARAALVFGPERTGLSVEAVSRCQALVSIPSDADYGSLNLAQAVQVISFCLGQQARGVLGSGDLATHAPAAEPSAQPAAQPAAQPSAQPSARLASQAAIEGFFEHLQASLIRLRFLDPAHPKKLMPRLRRLFGRTRLEVEEVDLLRGICTQIDKLHDGRR